MAQLKDLIVNGASRLIGDAFTNKITISTLADSTGSTGSDGQVLQTSGANISWATLGGAANKGVTDSTSASAIGTGTSLPTERDIYYGLPTINNAHNYTSNTTIYAPTAGGTADTQALVGNGATTAPKWVNISPSISITAGDGSNAPKINVTVLGRSGTAQAITTASTSAYGVTKLYNGVDSTSTTLAATANAVKTAYDKANGIVAAADAMVFKGVLNGASSTTYTPAADRGHTYKVNTAGLINGEQVETGDILICTTDNTDEATSSNVSTIKANWVIVQNNIDGAVYRGANTFTDANIIIADSTAGKVKSSGKTITTTTPASGATDSTIPTSKAVWAAIDALDGNLNNTTAGAGKTLTAFSQTNGKISATFGNISISKSQISDFPTTMTPASHSHGNITNDGKITTTATIANGDKLVIVDSDSTAGSKITGSSITFDGSTTSKALTQKGTWETFNNYSHPTGDGNKHVPANGTTNNGKFLQATATAGTYQWANAVTSVTAGTGLNTSADQADSATKGSITTTGTLYLTTSGVTANTYGNTSQQTPSHGGTFNIPYFTVDKYGRITAANTTTVKLPADNNTDTKVTQGTTTTTSWRKVLLNGASGTTYAAWNTEVGNDVTDITYRSVGVSVQPSTNTLKANNINAARAFKNLITGTGTAGSDAGSGDNRYKPARWTFNTGTNAADGEIYTIKIPVAGHDYGVFMSVDNGANYYPVVANGTGRVTIHYGNGTYVQVIFEPTGSAASMYPLAGGTSRQTITGGVFRVINYYDSNTNTLLRVYSSATDLNVPLIGQSSANSTTAAWSTYTGTYKDWYGAIPNDDAKRAKINLSTGMITAPGGITGNLTGNASSASTVSLTETTPSSNTSYYLTYATGKSGNQTLRANADLYYYDTGTTSYLNVGSSSNSGGLTLHNANGKLGNIVSSAFTENRTFTLPDKTGTIALTSDSAPAINGVYYGVCSTEQATKTKTVTLTNGTNFALAEGCLVAVKFTNASAAATMTLNVNGTGAKNLCMYGTTTMSSTTHTNGWRAGAVVLFVYDGTQWERVFWENTTYWNESIYVSTAADNAAKVGNGTYTLEAGKFFQVLITNANTKASALTLNINNKGAKPIYINGTASSSSNYTLPQGYYLVYYDGTNYHFRTDSYIPGNIAGTASNVRGTVAIANGGTGKTTAAEAWTALGGGSVGKLSYGSGTTTYLRNDGTWVTPTGDHKVTQEAAITTAGAYPIILATSTATTAQTNTVNKTSTLTYNPSTKKLHTPILEVTTASYGETLPSSGTAGQLFFQTSSGSIYELPAGGTTGQVLVKNSANDRDVTWGNPANTTTAVNATNAYTSASTAKAYIVGATTNAASFKALVHNASVYTENTVLFGAAWNDYAEFRKDNQNEIQEPGRCVAEQGDGALALTTQRLQRGCEIISDTFGFAIGQDEENGYNTPIAVSGRVLAYVYEGREAAIKHIGWPVCSGPNGTVSIMTEEEEEKYPSRIIGTISEIPNYEYWGAKSIAVKERVWVRIK